MSNKIDLEFNENFKGGRQVNYAYEQYMETPTPMENYAYDPFMGSMETPTPTPTQTSTPIEKISNKVLDRVNDIKQIMGKNQNNDGNIQADLYDITYEIRNIKYEVNNSIAQFYEIKDTLQDKIREIDDLIRSLSSI